MAGIHYPPFHFIHVFLNCGQLALCFDNKLFVAVLLEIMQSYGGQQIGSCGHLKVVMEIRIGEARKLGFWSSVEGGSIVEVSI